MSQADVILEAQDFLLGAGDPAHLVNEYADVLRELGLSLPVWTTARTIVNLWSFLTLDLIDVTTDTTTAAQGTGTALSTTTDGEGHLLAGMGKYDTVTYTVSVIHAGGTPVYRYDYWNGDLFTPLTLLQTPDFGTLGLQTLAFVLPQDWSPTPPADVTLPAAFDGARFWVRVLATTAPTTTAAVAQVAVRQHTFPLESREQGILALTYYPQDITKTEVSAALDLVLPAWRTQVGTPRMYHQAEETALAVRVVPLPENQGVENGLLGIIAGGGGPIDDNLVLFASVVPREEDVPPWLEGLAVLRLAAREAMRLGETQSAELAAALAQMSAAVEQLVRDTMAQEFM